MLRLLILFPFTCSQPCFAILALTLFGLFIRHSGLHPRLFADSMLTTTTSVLSSHGRPTTPRGDITCPSTIVYSKAAGLLPSHLRSLSHFGRRFSRTSAYSAVVSSAYRRRASPVNVAV